MSEANTAPPPYALVLRLLMGKLVSQAICAAAELGVADALGEEPRSSGELAAAIHCHAPSLYRLLRTLTSVGVFHERVRDEFSHTPLSLALRQDAEGSVRSTARMVASEWHSRPWAEVTGSIRTGRAAFEAVYGANLFAYLREHDGAARIFHETMTGLSALENHAIVAAYDFGSGQVVDVGGGEGSLLECILKARPAARGVILDSAAALGAARARLGAAGLLDRCSLVEGNFFDSVGPAGADCYVLKHILHDWDDARATAILRNVREAMRPGSTLAVVEHLIPAPGVPSMGKLLDLDMLVLVGGRERTVEEFEGLFAGAGFELERVLGTAAEISVLCAKSAVKG